MEDSLWSVLAGLPPVAWLRGSSVAYLLVNAAHIGGLGMLLGSIVTLDMRLLGLFREAPLPSLAHVLSRTAMAGLMLAILSGIWLFSVNAVDYLSNTAFLAKLALVGLGVINALCLHARPCWRQAMHDGQTNPGVRLHACLSLLLWPAALIAGRWIGFL